MVKYPVPAKNLLDKLRFMRGKVFFFVAFVPLVLSCADANLPNVVDEAVPIGVTFEAPAIPVVDETATRVSVAPSGTEYSFHWEAADTVGIFPNAGSQVYFSMSSGVGTNNVQFDGGAWWLRLGSRYSSYYPFVGDMYLQSTRIPVDFTGQCQTGTSTFDGANFFLAAPSATVVDGRLHFTYRMLNTLFRVEATLPAGTYTKMSMSLDEPLFVKEGHYNLSNPSIVADRRTKTLDVALENFTVASANTPVSVYATQAPVDLTGKTVTVNFESSEGRSYSCQISPSREYVAGMCYRFTCAMTPAIPAPQVLLRQDVWPSAAQAPNYNSSQTVPYLQWYARPVSPNGTVALLLGGEDYNTPPEEALLDQWADKLTAKGVQCVALMYRTPRPTGGLQYYLSALQDAQRAVRIIRNAVTLDHDNFPFDASKIGVVGWSAGAQVGLFLATSSQTAVYTPVDAYEAGLISCNINWAILDAPAYATSDSDGSLPSRDGYGTDVTPNPAFAFDASLCPSVCFLHGEDDPYSPRASTLLYRWYRLLGKPAEVHLYPGVGHEPVPIDRGIEYLAQMGFLGSLGSAQDIEARYASNSDRSQLITENVWPSGQIPNWDSTQSIPYLEWHFPVNRKTDAVQIIYSGGAYEGDSPDFLEVAPIRRYLNAKGVTVVTLCYRYQLPSGRPTGLPKHLAAWQDLQRTIRVVRNKAAQYGLDPGKIGIMGFSAGGHLTLVGSTSSQRQAYSSIDAIDLIPCNPQWGIAFYPAYSLTDDDMYYSGNAHGGNLDTDVLVPEFSFDPATPSMLFIHGDADTFSSMASVKAWERLRSMGIPAECHTYVLNGHCLQASTYPGTGSYNCFDRVWEYLEQRIY